MVQEADCSRCLGQPFWDETYCVRIHAFVYSYTHHVRLVSHSCTPSVQRNSGYLQATDTRQTVFTAKLHMRHNHQSEDHVAEGKNLSCPREQVIRTVCWLFSVSIHNDCCWLAVVLRTKCRSSRRPPHRVHKPSVIPSNTKRPLFHWRWDGINLPVEYAMARGFAFAIR